MKYSDIIGLHDNFFPFVDLQNEKSDFYWKQFIPISQFLNLLNKTVDSVASCQSICRNSIWVKGTYGTGKSHAGSVVKHLLCDDMNEIVDYLHILPPEYEEKLLHFRKSKRLFPIVLKGLENGCIHDMRSFLLTLERIIKDSLRNAGHDNIAVQSNFERAIAFLESTPINIDEIIANEPKLRSYAKSKEGIIKKLHISDVDVYLAVEEALAKPQYSIRFTVSDDLIKWLSEVEKEIASKSIADGLLVIWDEFTSVMDTIPNGMTNMIQNIAELTKKQNIYLYLISHRNSKAYHDADISKMESRFHLIRYDMEAPTTYRIMSASIKKLDAEQYDLCRRSRMDNLSELIAYLTENDSQQSIRDIKDLFPFHPYSSYLCSTIANQIGSAQRTIMQFMHDRQSGFLGFLDDENNYDKGLLLTADKLWDYFLKEFQDDSEKFGIVNQTFYTQKKTVENKGSSFEKVFKGILLLNAMCKKVGEADKIVPSRQNIKYLFDGENFDISTIDEILDFFHKNQIVNRDPSDNFLISLSALPVNEINDAINRAKSFFSDAKKILYFDSLYFKGKINEIFEESLIRQPSLAYLACFPNDDFLVRNQIKSTFKESSYKLNIALFFAMDNTEYLAMTKIVKDFSAKEDYNNMIFLMFDEIFDYDDTQRRSFYEYVATAEVAGKRHNKTSEKTNSENAKKIIINWIDRLKQGMAKIYFRGEQNTINISTITKHINNHYCGKIFSNGVETLSSLKKSPMTFWKIFKNPSKASIDPILAATDRNEVECKFKGQYVPAKLLFKNDNDDYIVDADLALKPDAPENHPLVQMQKKVDEIFESIKRSGVPIFNLGRVLRPLTQPPFGLYSIIPNMAALAFVMRKYVNELNEIDSGELVDKLNMRDKVIEIFNYWQKESNDNKLKVRFGSKEEKELKDLLIDIFDIQHSHPINVRWEVRNCCVQKFKLPLWCLKYTPSVSTDFRVLIGLLDEWIQKDILQSKWTAEILRSIKLQLFELKSVLSNGKAFEDGFKNFVQKIESVIIDDNWWGELKDYLKQNLQGEIGYWQESNVEKEVMKFCINKMKKTETALVNRSA